MKKILTLFVAAMFCSASLFAAVSLHDGVYYSLYELDQFDWSNGWIVTKVQNKTFEVGNIPSAQLSFDCKKSNGSQVGTVRVYIKCVGENERTEDIAMSNLSTTSFRTFTYEIGNKPLEYIKCEARNCSYVTTFANVKVTMASYLNAPSVDVVDFGSVRLVDVTDVAPVQTFSIDWCNTEALDTVVTGVGREFVSITRDNNAEPGNFNTSTYTIVMDRSQVGYVDLNMTITGANGYNHTVAIKGSTTAKPVADLTIVSDIVLPFDTWNASFNLSDYVSTTSDGAIEVSASSDSDIATYTDGVFYAGAKNGTATFLISVPETENFAAIVAKPLTITVDQVSYSYVQNMFDFFVNEYDFVDEDASIALHASIDRSTASNALTALRSAFLVWHADNAVENDDLTALLDNTTFDALAPEEDWDYGWTGGSDATISGDKDNQMTAYQRQSGNSAFSGRFAQMWQASTTLLQGDKTLAAGELSQQVTLHAGIYRLSAKISTTNMTMVLFAGDSTLAVNTDAETCSLEFVLTEQTTISVGVRHESVKNRNNRWVAVDDFQLTYVGAISSGETPTGCDSLLAAPHATKFYRDGTLYIRRGEALYDMSGRKVE